MILRREEPGSLQLGDDELHDQNTLMNPVRRLPIQSE
jgi:hypothetical protein